MGTARHEAFLLPPGPDTPAQLELRLRLLAERQDDVVAALPGAAVDEAVRGLAAVVDERVAAGDTTSVLAELGSRHSDDLCVLADLGDGSLRLVAAIVCFPSHWRLADKVGRSAAEIHAPVPRYDTELATRVDGFLGRLRPGVVAARCNWALHERPDLFAPQPPAPEGRPPSQWWLRSERQALTGLVGGAVAFSIRTRQIGLGDLRAARPDVAGALADRLRAEPAALAHYRGYDEVRQDLARFLGP